MKRSGEGGVFAELRARIVSDKFALACFAAVSLIAVACLCADLIAPYSYSAQDLSSGVLPPSRGHLFGTDALGRDVFSRALFGGRVDAAMMRVVDIIYALPFTIFVILLMVAFGRSLWLIFVAIGAVEWLTMARIARAAALEVKSRQFVEASVALGQTRFGVFAKHILPNMLSPVFACAALTVPSVMMLEAFLSFLGLGVQAPLPSWGSLIKDGAEYMEDAPWLLVFPSLLFSITLFCLNRVGEALSEGRGR